MEHQEKPKTEFVDIADLLKAEGIRKSDEPEKVLETDGEDVFNRITGQEPVIVEDKKEEVITAPTPETKTTAFTEKLKDYISAGFLDDVQINIGEGDELEQKFLSELQDLDADTFETIISEYKKAKDKELKEKYVPLEGLNDRTKNYIEILRAGGDISKLVETQVEYVNPLSQFDLDNEKDQETLVRQSLKAQGLKPKFIEQEIEELIKDVALSAEADKIAAGINKSFDDYLEQKKQEQFAKIEADKQEQKEFKKIVGTAIKELVPNEGVAKVLLDNSTKRDEFGLTNTDKLYFEAQKDPKLYAEVTLFLNNREEFIKIVNSGVKNKEALKTMKTMITITPTVVKTVTKDKKPESKGDEVFERLTAQFNK